MIKKARLRYLRTNERGSALLSAFLAITVILILGTGILTLSLANIKQARVDDTYERDYYVADGGAKQGVEALKSAALEQYRKIAGDLKNNIQSTNNAVSFFAALDAISYAPPQPDSSAGGPTSLTVAISHAAVDADTHRYSVLSTATDGKTKRAISGSIDISFVPVVAQSSALPFPENAAMCGGTFYMDNTASSVNLNLGIGGNVQFGAYVNPNTNIYYDGFSANNKGAAGWIDPSTASLLNWSLAYSNLKASKMNVTPSVPASSNINSNSFPNGNAPSPVYLEGLPSSDMTVSVTISGGGQIVSYKGLSLQGCSYGGTPSSYLTVFCSGNMTFGSTSLNYCKIYCDGNVAMSGGGDIGNSEIYCGGNVNLGSYGISNTCIVSGNTATLGCGSISGSSVVYASNDINIAGGTGLSGLFYAGDSIYINAGGNISGQMVAKGDIHTKSGCSYNINYSSSVISGILGSPYIDNLGGSGNSAIIQPADSKIYGSSSFSEQ